MKTTERSSDSAGVDVMPAMEENPRNRRDGIDQGRTPLDGVGEAGAEELFCEIGGERFIGVDCHRELKPFLVNVVSDDDHWMFVGSNGAITAGRPRVSGSGGSFLPSHLGSTEYTDIWASYEAR